MTEQVTQMTLTQKLKMLENEKKLNIISDTTRTTGLSSPLRELKVTMDSYQLIGSLLSMPGVVFMGAADPRGKHIFTYPTGNINDFFSKYSEEFRTTFQQKAIPPFIQFKTTEKPFTTVKCIYTGEKQ